MSENNKDDVKVLAQDDLPIYHIYYETFGEGR